jgi:mannose-6-phosphate isomerase-like protein (cupin superfamily)
MQTAKLPEGYTALAPDGSQIRELVTVTRGSLVHCLLPPGATSRAVVHATVEEIWYVVQGRGQVWRADETSESVVDVTPGVALTIETGCRFQFRNTGDGDLCFVLVTMPPWPGGHEARRVKDHWPVRSAAAAAEP